MTILLSARQISKQFTGLLAVNEVDVDVAAGSVHGIIGPNGAGKTTFFNLVSGLLPPTSGTLTLDGHDITGAAPYERTRMGVARTFQNIRMFSDMTVVENVMTGMHTRLDSSGLAALLRLPAFRREERAAKAKAMELLEFVRLADKAGLRSGDLSYGDQRRLEIARALAGNPRLLLLDEPAAGMNPTETRDLAALLRQVARRDITLLLVEHNMGFVMDLCDRITVLNFGRKIAEGTAREVRDDPAVIEAYLGTKVAERLAKAHGA
ncbi:ABC transporter ATP-binding protein [Skermanella rosea]|uniref:ABC transporter ATP-binding protein n=1 Tax=Skermanella rosea TaxID=1817965 RepID=UPI00193126DB|nr:ABC transporter ATP-binding protein [Skermanella rosea]UEM01482.1 ABC transporter ATP-binding protein [Skermanella rosea]